MSEDTAALVEQVRAGIRIHPDEPTDVMVALEVQADAALATLVQRLGGEPDAVWEDMRAYNLRLEERAWAAEAEVKQLRERIEEAASVLPDPMHPHFPRELIDRQVRGLCWLSEDIPIEELLARDALD